MSDVTDAERSEAMYNALRSYKEAYGHEATCALLERVAGVDRPSQVPADKISAVIAATEAIQKPSPKTLGELDTAGIYARWNERWRRPERGES